MRYCPVRTIWTYTVHIMCWSKQALVWIIGVPFVFLWRLIAWTMHKLCCCFSRCKRIIDQCGNVYDTEIQIVGLRKECGTTTNSFNETAEDTKNVVTQLRKKVESLNLTNKRLVSENARLKNSSDEITKQMAFVMETKGQLENTSDDFSNLKLSRRFRQDLLENKYISLLEWLTQDQNKEELQVIDVLSKLLLKCYNICVRLADDQIKNILLLQKNDVSPTELENADVFRNRRQIGQTEGQRKRIKEVVLKDLFMSESMYGRTGKETQGKLKDFFEEYADSCWLMTISNPPLALKFDIVGSYYTGKIEKRFKKYATQEPVRGNSKSKGTVLHVVWPAVLLADGSGFYAKGEVVVVDESSPIETDIF